MKIKFNWGTGIILALIGYVGIIGLLIFISSKQDRSLMREDYYYHSIHHQDEIDAAQRFSDLGPGLGFTQLVDSIHLSLPKSLDNDSIRLRIYFFRPSDENFDFTVESKLKAKNGVSIPVTSLRRGKYFVRIELEKDGKFYLHEMDYVFDPK